MAELLIYRSSAGSGKTHTLVMHYIRYALRYPDAFKHILAVTFTNSATQEMKERIIIYLHNLSLGEGIQEMASQIGWAPTFLQKRSKQILSMILYQYGDFAVTTIDSFFHRIIQSFADTLGLKKNFSVEMDEPLVETIEALLALEDPLLQKWIIDFSLNKLSSGQTWHVKRNIYALGKAIFNESFKLYEEALRTIFAQKELWPKCVLAIQTYMQSFEVKMQTIGQTALSILQQQGFHPTNFSYGTKGVIGYFLKLANKKDFQPTKRALIAKEKLQSWYTQSPSEEKTTMAKIVKELLHPLLLQAIDLYEQEGLSYRTALVGSRFSYAFGMIGALLIGLEDYRCAHNLLFMSDIATLLYQSIRRNDTPFLYEQISNQFHHFLIDEFQDLSLFQWMNIKPLLRNSLAQGHSSLLVGDVKQAIYRWRGSNWKLLNHEVVSEFKESQVCYLTTNRRSQAAIVFFNNSFFKAAFNHLIESLEEKIPLDLIQPNEWAQMKKSYAQVAQATTAPKEGYVSCLFFRSDQLDATGCTISWEAQVQKEIVKLLATLHNQAIQAKDIVILVRNNSQAKWLTSLSGSDCAMHPYKISSDAVYDLWNHIAIKVLIYALHYLHDPLDLINKAAFIQAYSSCMEKPRIIWHDYRLDNDVYSKDAIERLLPESFWVQKYFLKNSPIYTCVQLLIKTLLPPPHDWGDVLSFFQTIVLNFSITECNDLPSFLLWWHKKGVTLKLPVSHDVDRIRVMTIHQSKGLAFKVVIMPFCNWHLDHSLHNAPILWSGTPAQVAHFPIWPIPYSVDLKETDYAKDYYLEQMQVHLDNINLLYVAFTRAQEQLYVMAPFPENSRRMATIADLIYESLATQQRELERLPLSIDLQEEEGSTRFSFRCKI